MVVLEGISMTPTRDRRILAELEGTPLVDTRTGNRHKEGYVAPNKYTRAKKEEVSKWTRRVIVAWDGEGANLDTGEHVYNLLANSNGDYIINLDGLSTIEVFNFFLYNSNDRDINVIFGGSYDINMILRDVPRDQLQILWSTGMVYWKGFQIMWASRKKFTVKQVGKGKNKSFVLWDVIGYFQSSFVVACEKWLGDLDVLKDIQEMKLKRSEFKSEDIESIVEYNKKECILLVLLMDRLFASLDEAEVELKRYDGAGSIAAALLLKNNVQLYKGTIPSEVNRYAQYAYSGGRIEAIKCGTTTKQTPIYQYDINSAYPYACISLPSYVGATWLKESHWDGSTNSLVCVKYHYKKEAPFYPLWYRDTHGSICYPRYGYGVYWGAEVENLYKYYEEGIDFEIEWSINCTLADDTKPFNFIVDLFELRKKFKERGSMASESLKLGLNSIYGKLVQQAGYKNSTGRIPTYHQLLWGGQITAATRARMFDAAMQDPSNIISFATDAVFSTKPLDLPLGKELGEFDYKEYTGITIVQAGVYFLQNGDEWNEKYRGFDKGSLERNKIVECWRTGEQYEAKLTRFVGLGSAIMATDFNIWRTWRTDTRKLDINPTGKRISGSRTDYHNGLRDTKARPNITSEVISEPYALQWVDGLEGLKTGLVEEVPLDKLLEEMEDGGL